eukprot:988447-Prorocentrum_minimum.AAC.1
MTRINSFFLFPPERVWTCFFAVPVGQEERRVQGERRGRAVKCCRCEGPDRARHGGLGQHLLQAQGDPLL